MFYMTFAHYIKFGNVVYCGCVGKPRNQAKLMANSKQTQAPSKEVLEEQYVHQSKPVAQLARELGATVQQVRYWLKKHRLLKKQRFVDCSHDDPGRPPVLLPGDHYWYPPDTEWLQHQHYLLGKTTYEIATMIGASQGTVNKWLAEEGLPILRYPRLRGRPLKKTALLRYPRNRGRWLMKRAAIPELCAKCNAVGVRLVVHHKDLDPTNNLLENLEYLCYSCHRKLHSSKS